MIVGHSSSGSWQLGVDAAATRRRRRELPRLMVMVRWVVLRVLTQLVAVRAIGREQGLCGAVAAATVAATAAAAAAAAALVVIEIFPC